MLKLRYLSVLISQRLTLAAQEIFKDVEETIVELHDETKLVKLENAKLKLKLREFGINLYNESTEVVAPASSSTVAQSCEEPRTEVGREASPTVASVKEELDALAENGWEPEDNADMDIKTETNFTDCTAAPEKEASDTQPDARVTATPEDVMSWLALEPREPEVFPCVARTWSVQECGGAEAGPPPVLSQITERSCAQSKEPSDDNDDDYEDFDDAQDDGHAGNDHFLNSEPAEMPDNSQMPKKRPYTRRQPSKRGNTKQKNGTEETNERTSPEPTTQVVKRKVGRPRKNPPISIPLSALNDPQVETENSQVQSRLRSGNEGKVITGKRRGRKRRGPYKKSKKALPIDSKSAPIGRPPTRVLRLRISKTEVEEVDLKNGENVSVRKSDRIRIKPTEDEPEEENLKNGGNVSGRKSSRTRIKDKDEESEEVSLQNTVLQKSSRKKIKPIDDKLHPETGENGYLRMSMRTRGKINKDKPEDESIKDEQNLSIQRSSRTKVKPNEANKRDEDHLQNEQNTSVQEPSLTVRVGRPRGRPKRNSQITTDNPSNEGHLKNVSEDPPSTSSRAELEGKNCFPEQPPVTLVKEELEEDNGVLEPPLLTLCEGALQHNNKAQTEEPDFNTGQTVMDQNDSASTQTPFTTVEVTLEQVDDALNKPTSISSEPLLEQDRSVSEESPVMSEKSELEKDVFLEPPLLTPCEVEVEQKSSGEVEEAHNNTDHTVVESTLTPFEVPLDQGEGGVDETTFSSCEKLLEQDGSVPEHSSKAQREDPDFNTGQTVVDQKDSALTRSPLTPVDVPLEQNEDVLNEQTFTPSEMLLEQDKTDSEEPPVISGKGELVKDNIDLDPPPLLPYEVALDHKSDVQTEETHFSEVEMAMKHTDSASVGSALTSHKVPSEQAKGFLDEPCEKLLKQDCNVYEDPPVTSGEGELEKDNVELGPPPLTSCDAPLEHKKEDAHFSADQVAMKQNASDLLQRFTPLTSVEVPSEQAKGVLDKPTVSSSETVFEQDDSVSDESPYSPGDVEFEDENSVPVEPTFSAGEKYFEKNELELEKLPGRKSERVRRIQAEKSTTQPVEERKSASSDEDSSESEGDSSGFDKPSSRQIKRRRTPSSDFEFDNEQEGESSSSSEEESSGEDSSGNERPRKQQRVSKRSDEEAGLETGVTVKTIGNKHDKRNYCLYCSAFPAKISRHLVVRHYDERDVAMVLGLPKKSKERKMLLDRIRNSGNRAHNDRVLKEGKGVLIPARAYKSGDVPDYEYCSGCQGMFSKDWLIKHLESCKWVVEKEGHQPVLPEVLPKKDFSEILSGMYEDDVTGAVRGDELLLKLGQHLVDKRMQSERILQKLRQLGRLLLNGRKITPLKKMEDYIRCSNWSYVTAAVKNVAEYSESTQTFTIPRYAACLRISLCTIAGIIKCDSKTNGDKEALQNADMFLDSIRMKWHQEFSAAGTSTSQRSSVVTEEPQEVGGDKNCASSVQDVDDAKTDGGVGHNLEKDEDAEEDDYDDIDDSDADDDDDADDEDDGGNGVEENGSQCADGDGQESITPLPVVDSKTDNSMNDGVKQSCEGTQTATSAKPLTAELKLQPQSDIAEATSSVNIQDGDSTTVRKTTDAFLSGLINNEDISLAGKGNINHCLFCQQKVSKLSRHLESRHPEEEGVAKALSYPKGSKERKLCFRLILHRGNRAHNTRVLKEGKGDVVIKRNLRQSAAKPSDCRHCPYCDGLFLKHMIPKHLKDCPFMKEEDRAMIGKGQRGWYELKYGPQPDNVSEELWKILTKMNQDEVTVAAKGDKYALQLAEQLLDKGQGDDAAFREAYIRQRLRELGRLLVSCQKITPMYSLMDFILPHNWNHVVAAVKDVAGYNEPETAPNSSLLSQLYRSLQKVGSFVESDAVSQQDKQMTEYARAFNKSFVEKWRKLFPTPYTARKSRQQRRNGVKLLSFTEDINNLHTYLKGKVGESFSALCASPSQTTWADIAKMVLAQLIMFNRTKAREVSRLTVKEFCSKKSYGMPDDTDDLTPFEHELCKYTSRIEISRANGDNMQILIPPFLVNIVDTMLQRRMLCSIRYDNSFVFAQPRSITFMSGPEALESVAKDCGAKHVKKLLSDGLREHVAVISRLLYLKDMPQVTDFMGLSLVPRLRTDCAQQQTLELARLGKVLITMEKGQPRPTDQNVEDTVVTPDEIVQQTEWSSGEEDDEEEEDEEEEEDAGDDDDDKDYRPSRAAKSQQVAAAAVKKRRSGAKSRWTDEEVQAVERHMAPFINSGKTPGKRECTACILAEPEALKARKWESIKFYTKNRIVSLRRKSRRTTRRANIN